MINALNLMLVGMLGIFFVMLLIFLLIKFLLWAFPEPKKILRKISKATGKVISEEEVKPQL